MLTDKRTYRRPFAAMIVAALTLATPQGGAGQGPAARPDSNNSAAAGKQADAWYPEGPVRIRGKRYSLFVGATFTWFANRTSRARYGEGTWSPSIELYRPQRHGFSPIFEVNGMRIGSADTVARFFAVSAGVRYRPVDAEPSRWFVLSAGLAAGPRVARIPGRERTTVGGLSAQVGVELLRTARVTLRYEALPVVHGARLSTLSLGTAVRLWPHGGRHASPAATCADTPCTR